MLSELKHTPFVSFADISPMGIQVWDYSFGTTPPLSASLTSPPPRGSARRARGLYQASEILISPSQGECPKGKGVISYQNFSGSVFLCDFPACRQAGL